MLNQPPPCPKNEVCQFLISKKWHLSESLSTRTKEVWLDVKDEEMVFLRKNLDYIPFGTMIVIVEEKMGYPMTDVPFYKKDFLQRYTPN